MTYNKEKWDAFEKARAVPKTEHKTRYVIGEDTSFEDWCRSEYDYDVIAEKPKQTRAIYALKDEHVNTLFNRLDEWKSASKIMTKLYHPDSGGNTLAMSMLNDFKELMSSLEQIRKVTDYEDKVEALKVEYSTGVKMISS